MIGHMTQTAEPMQQTWVPDDSTFGARLALIRQGKKWRNIKLAAQICGVPTATWRSWEERTTPGLPRELDRVRQIADVAGVDYMWLLTGQAGHSPSTGEDGMGSTRRCSWSRHLRGGRSTRPAVTLRHLAVA